MEEKIDAMDKDSLVAALSTCNEKVFGLKEQYAKTVGASAKELKTSKAALMDYMESNNISCVMLEEDLYLRLFHRCGGGETLTPKLFMDIVNGLTAAQFKAKVKQIEDERQSRHEDWISKQLVDVKKTLLKDKKQKQKAAARPAKKPRPSKRSKVESMAATAQALGSEAADNIETILASASAAGCDSKEEVQGDDDDEDEDDIDTKAAAIVARMPIPVPEVKHLGKDKAYAQRPPPAFGRPLTVREMFVEVLYTLIKERHKPIKPVMTVDTRPGKSVDILSHGPWTFFDQARKYVTLKTRVGALQTENRLKRKEYTAIMNRCKTRLLPLLGASKYEASMPTSGGLRNISIEVVKSEECVKRLTMWEIGRMLEEAAKSVSGNVSFSATHTVQLLSEDVMSHLIRNVLRQMAVYTAEHTTTVEKVRIRRSREHKDGDEDAGEYDDDDDDNDSVSSFDNS